jgi:fucose permease
MYFVGILGMAIFVYVGVNIRRGVWLGVEMGHKLLLPGEITAFMLSMQFRGRKSGREKMRIHHLVHTALYSVESTSSQSDLLGPLSPPFFQS